MSAGVANYILFVAEKCIGCHYYSHDYINHYCKNNIVDPNKCLAIDKKN